MQSLYKTVLLFKIENTYLLPKRFPVILSFTWTKRQFHFAQFYLPCFSLLYYYLVCRKRQGGQHYTYLDQIVRFKCDRIK